MPRTPTILLLLVLVGVGCGDAGTRNPLGATCGPAPFAACSFVTSCGRCFWDIAGRGTACYRVECLTR